jgi:hypothetical protein
VYSLGIKCIWYVLVCLISMYCIFLCLENLLVNCNIYGYWLFLQFNQLVLINQFSCLEVLIFIVFMSLHCGYRFLCCVIIRLSY